MPSDFSQLTPFTPNPEVLQAIRPMRPSDCREVGELHRAAMGHSLWAQLGIDFLQRLYSELLRNPRFIAYVYEEDGSIGGFIAGTSDSPNLFCSTLRHSWHRLLWPVLQGICRRPRLLGKLLLTHTYFARSRARAVDNCREVRAESLFCSFKPHLRGKRISGHINKVLFEHLLRLGLEEVKITTELSNPGSNRQLQSWGFQEKRRFDFYGKSMVTYVLELRGHPRLEQPGTAPARLKSPEPYT